MFQSNRPGSRTSSYSANTTTNKGYPFASISNLHNHKDFLIEQTGFLRDLSRREIIIYSVWWFRLTTIRYQTLSALHIMDMVTSALLQCSWKGKGLTSLQVIVVFLFVEILPVASQYKSY